MSRPGERSHGPARTLTRHQRGSALAGAADLEPRSNLVEADAFWQAGDTQGGREQGLDSYAQDLYFTLRVRKVCQSEYDRACTPSVVSQSRYHSHVMVTSE